MTTTIDIDVTTTTNNVTITAEPNEYVVNINTQSGGGGVQSVTGDIVDNTDPENPVVNVPNLTQVLTQGDKQYYLETIPTDEVLTLNLGRHLTTNYFDAENAGTGGLFLDKTIEFPEYSTIDFQAGFAIDSQGEKIQSSYKFTTDAEVYYLGELITEITMQPNQVGVLKWAAPSQTEGQVWFLTILNVGGTIPTQTSDLTNDGADGTSTYVEADELGAAAFSNDYNDLSNKPTIPAAQVNSDWNSVSGVSQILNKPTIPAAQVNSDWNAVSGVAQILNKPTIPSIAGLVRNIVKDAAVSSTLTGTTTETILKSYQITGGTFSATDIINLASARFTKTGGSANAINLKMYVNTSNSLSGATLIAGLTNVQGFYYKFGRTFTLRGGNIIGYSSTGNGIQIGLDYGNISIVPTSATLNPANTFWIIFSGQLTVTTDTLIASEILITN